jgi:hypothetical protein
VKNNGAAIITPFPSRAIRRIDLPVQATRVVRTDRPLTSLAARAKMPHA